MNSVAPVVVFQYRPTSKADEECPASVLDDLNLWVRKQIFVMRCTSCCLNTFTFFEMLDQLVQVMERACHDVHMDIVDVDESGYSLRFCPYDCKSFPSMETMERFITCLDEQVVRKFSSWNSVVQY